MTCFFCSNQINPQRQRWVQCCVEHYYKQGGFRQSERGFHLSCFHKFVRLNGRPFNPHTYYRAIDAVVRRGEENLYEVEA